MIKILKNTTLEELVRAGHTIPAEGQWQVPYDKWIKILDDASLLADIASGDLVVNDGDEDLSVIDALAYLQIIDQSLSCRNKIKQNQSITIPSTYQEAVVNEIILDGEIIINGVWAFV